MTYNNDNNNLPSQLLQIMSNLALSGKAILQINQLPLEFRKYLLAFLQNQLELDKDIPTDLIIMNQQYEIEFTDSKKLYLVRNAFFKIFNSPNAKDIFTYLFRDLITYQYPLNLFPNSLCNVNGLILHPILKKHHDLIPKIVTILNLYRILKASRNDTAHARENKRGLFKKSTDIQEQIKLCLKEIRYIRDFMSRNTKR